MEGIRERFLKFRYNGMLVIVFIFALIAVILFFERSGIKYNYTNASLELLPADKVVTKLDSNTGLSKDTLVLWDSTKAESLNAMKEFECILSDMKVGYENVDLAMTPFPDLYEYQKAIVLVSDLSSVGENVIDLSEWVHNGGRVQFAVTLQQNIYTSVINNMLGILDSSWGNVYVDSIFIDDAFMIGGGRCFDIEDGYESAWGVQLDSDNTVCYAWVNNESKSPLIWETEYGEGKAVIVNIGLNEKFVRGFYAAAYSLLDDIAVYPVINSSAFYLDDFPSQIPSGNNEYIVRDYGTSIRDFYVNIWWPDMMNYSDRYGLKFTGLAIACYDDNVDGSTPSEPDKGTFLSFGNMLLRKGGEIGYHGYNHQPLCMSECDYGDLYDYKTWESENAMEGAFDFIVDLCEELFPDVKISLYVPPSNIMSDEGEKFLINTYPHIKTISGIYFPDGDFEHGCTQEFDVFSDGTVHQPRVISGCDLNPFMEVALVSELNMHYINGHFTHPDDALDPERGAGLGWAELSSRFGEYLDYLYTSAPSIRNHTGSEMSAAIQRYVAVNVKKEQYENKLVLRIGNFYDEAFLFVRFNKNQPEDTAGGKLTHLTGNLYLLEAKSDTVTINLK